MERGSPAPEMDKLSEEQIKNTDLYRRIKAEHGDVDWKEIKQIMTREYAGAVSEILASIAIETALEHGGND